VNVDEGFASDRRGNVHVLEVEPATERVEYQRFHA
jgi:hypothetical protein